MGEEIIIISINNGNVKTFSSCQSICQVNTCEPAAYDNYFLHLVILFDCWFSIHGSGQNIPFFKLQKSIGEIRMTELD